EHAGRPSSKDTTPALKGPSPDRDGPAGRRPSAAPNCLGWHTSPAGHARSHTIEVDPSKRPPRTLLIAAAFAGTSGAPWSPGPAAQNWPSWRFNRTAQHPGGSRLVEHIVGGTAKTPATRHLPP